MLSNLIKYFMIFRIFAVSIIYETTAVIRVAAARSPLNILYMWGRK